MKKLFISIFILYSITLFAKNLDDTHNIGVLKEWKPYYSLDKNGKPKGYAIDLFEKLASNIGLKYEYIVVENWKEMWKFIELGKVDIVPNVGIALKRAEFLSFTQTTDVFEIGLYKNKKLKELKKISDIKDKTVGVVLKNVCTKLVNDNISKNKILYSSYHRSLAALESNEIDVLCYPKTIIESSIKELNIPNIEAFGKPLKVVNRAIGVAKTEVYLLDTLDKELLRIKGNGEYQKIYEKWFANHKDIEVNYEQLILFLLILLVVLFFALYIIRNNNLILTKEELNKKILEVEELKNQQLYQQKIVMNQSKVTAIGDMLGNIAHQWRQPLSIITTNVSSMNTHIELGIPITEDKIKECSKSVMKQALYLSKTIDDFKDFFNNGSEILETYNLKDIFKELEKQVFKSFKNNNIICVTDFEKDIDVLVNKSLLIQSLMNICNNSKDAIIENVDDIKLRYFFVETQELEDKAVLIFKDSGGGIKEDIIDKIFDPYFSTKHPSIGTGISLYMTNQIITKYFQGSIEVLNVEYSYNNTQLKGAMFKIIIPIDKK